MATIKPSLAVHPGQKRVLKDPTRHRVVVAGRRWGKTQLSKTAIITEAIKPRRHIWYIAPTYGMARGILWEELKEAIPRAWVRPNGINETRMSIRLINGTLIELKGADSKPDALRGRGLHLIIIDEAQDIDPDTFYKVLYPTFATTQGRFLIIGTPKAYNWLYDIYMRGQRGPIITDKEGNRRRNIWKSWQYATRESPFVPQSEIDEARHNLDPKTFRQEYEASFETMSGRVYHSFDRRANVRSCPFNPRLPIWIGQDFNIDPMSTVVLQPQPNGEIWVVDELYLHQSNTEEVAEELARRYYRYMKTKQITFYPDPAGNNRQTGRGQSDLDILKEAGFKSFRFRRKHPLVSDRVNAVNRMFRAADDTRRLFIDEGCTNLIKSLEETIYKEGSREVDKKLGTEHPADALGYPIELEFPVRKVEVMGVSI